MKIKGIMEYSLGNFLTFRGFAKLGDIARFSKPDEAYQRGIIEKHQKDLEKFFTDGKNRFFSELILGCYLPENDEEIERLEKFITAFKNNGKGNFGFRKCNIGIQQPKPYGDSTFKVVTISTLKEKSDENLFFRIDGNHRISAAENCDDDIKNLIAPIVVVFFRTENEYKTQSKMLFHNTNFKHIPLSKEQYLELIFKDEKILTTLKDNLGEEYFFAKQMYGNLNLDCFKHLSNIFEDNNKRTTLLEFCKFIKEDKKITLDDSIIDRVKYSFSDIDQLYKDTELEKQENSVIFTAFLYYSLNYDKEYGSKKIELFKKWILKNHIYNTKNIKLKSLIGIFDEIYKSRIKKIFVAMPFSDDFNNIWDSIVDVYDDLIKDGYDLSREFQDNKGKYMPYRVDKPNQDSKDIIKEIKTNINEADLMIADLTSARPNVYYELGLFEGKNKPFILLHDKTKEENDAKSVHFDLFTMERINYNPNSLKELKEKLKERLKNILKKQISEPF
ncbi:hypothetical protein CQA38_08200 [Campylobacter sp. MIT 12-5580]|uniref:hypothetical protein n=1 Tax=Campylobacter sp. MIT 12-5580 TaxID=2040651 RepID=UPI0010F7FC5B|nr:hypothetical protein [Campylobacter sp. MIT 12-5580]TKX28341.1 hypothetical protein CQA38_08200 [Campylobacter sp. MIT 12-5580]